MAQEVSNIASIPVVTAPTPLHRRDKKLDRRVNQPAGKAEPMVRYKQIVHTWMFGNTPFEQIVHLLACAGADGLDLSFALDGPYSWKNLLASAPKYTRLIRDAGMTVPAATPFILNRNRAL